jgi:hypothetical protein
MLLLLYITAVGNVILLFGAETEIFVLVLTFPFMYFILI